MTTFITGAGLIGAHVAKALQSRGETVALYDVAPSIDYLDTVLDVSRAHIVTGDITDMETVLTALRDLHVDVIVHTAALIGSSVSRQPVRGVEVNVGGSIAIIEAARRANTSRVVFCSSMAVYDFDHLPGRAGITEDAALGPKNLYAATKVASECLLSQFGNLYDMDVVHLRLAGVYGRGQYRGGSWMGRVLNRLLEAALMHREETLQPEWIGTNEYVYVKDVARAFAQCCLAKERIGGAYNIGTGILHSHLDVVDAIRELLPSARIRVMDERAPMASYLVRDQAFDISKAQAAFGYSPQFSLRDGLQDYIEELKLHQGKYITSFETSFERS